MPTLLSDFIKNRCSVLSIERKRGKHDDIVTNAALAVAKERMQRAKLDPDYATEHEYSSANTAHNKCEKALSKLKKAIKYLI